MSTEWSGRSRQAMTPRPRARCSAADTPPGPTLRHWSMGLPEEGTGPTPRARASDERPDRVKEMAYPEVA
jgi:hypothetical protein